MNVLKKKQFNTSKGFTLVELIVVLVIMMILISLGVAGILTWQDWSRFKKENTAAETIFYSLQNQFTELDSTDAFDSQVTKTVKATDGTTDSLFVADRNNRSWFEGAGDNKIYYEDDKYYVWDSIWVNTGSISDSEKGKYQGRIYYLSADKGDYDKYLNDPSSVDVGTKLLFDLVASYISEKSVLNGAIWVEFSPEARQVFSVCYSDRVDSFEYKPSTGSDSTGILDRTENKRREILMGYYASSSLSIPTKGRDVKKLGDIYFENEETFNLVVVEDNFDADNHYIIDVCPAFDDNTFDEDSPLMTLDFDLAGIKGNLKDAVSNPVSANIKFYEGYYVSQNFADLIDNGSASAFYQNVTIDKNFSKLKMDIPVYKRTNPTTNVSEVVIVLDATDVQAQAYLCADKNNPEPSFINTCSFYRFGFDLDQSKTLKIGCMRESETGDGFSLTDTVESPVFADAKHENDLTTYTIENCRHLYNVRFETDYKDNRPTEAARTENREFVVKKDLDWAQFAKDFYVDSYKIGKKSGIDYDGLNNYINKKLGNNGQTKQADYDFPGFRALGVNDVFKGEHTNPSNVDSRYYCISNLSISFSANMAYGVYGKEAKDEWNNNSVDDYNKYDNINHYSVNIDWENIYRFNTDTGKEKHPSYEKAMRGLYPLGLFAENSGTICDLELNRHRVIGMENLGSTAEPKLVFTNMVGGFAGNNLGNMYNLSLRNCVNLDGANDKANEYTGDNSTHINGRTDVGGILGRESWTVMQGSELTLKNMNNYAKVTGMENIGGIIGRAYLIRDFHARPNATGRDEYIEMRSYYFRRVFYDDGYDIYGEFSDDGSYKAGSSKSITGRTVNRITKLSIEDCFSDGEVRGDDLVYDNVIYLYENAVEAQKVPTTNYASIGIAKYDCDLSNYTHQCSNIGGIAGTLVDGAYYDCRRVGVSSQDSDVCDWSLTAKKEDRNITLKGCTSYRVYDDSVKNSLCSKANASIPDDIQKMLTFDYYVGGLVGYCKFTNIENCGNNSGNLDNTFVFGRNYVGGLFGCYDGSKIIVANNDYIVNDSNVIGVMYVGGFTGGAGIGACKQENYSFRHPSTNEGSMPSQINNANAIEKITGVKNTGVVLGVKRSSLSRSVIVSIQDSNIYEKYQGTEEQAWQERVISGTYDAGVGGIVGISRFTFNKASNIQRSKKLALEMIGITGKEPEDVTLNDLENVRSVTFYGGNAVGGITGIGIGGANVNNGNTEEINAIIYGDDAVGGVIGGCGRNQNAANINNCTLNNALIMGHDKVGGFAGINNLCVSGTQKKSYTVLGNNEVGGVFGATYNKANGFKSVTIDSSAQGVEVKICGRQKVGGFVGSDTKYSALNNNITLKGISVEADTHVGGVYGYIENPTNAKTFDFSRVTVDGVKVKANKTENGFSYAGGFVGLIPGNITVSSASFKGTIDSPSAYLGEITEVNNGTITNCIINSMNYCQDANRYAGGLCGLNTNTVVLNSGFAGGADLKGKYALGGYIGCNKGSIGSGDINGSTATLSSPVVGFLIGSNETDLDVKDYKIVSANIKSANYAGCFVGINKATIYNSEMSILSGVELANRRYNIDANGVQNVSKCGFNATLNADGNAYVGLLVGINEGTVKDISINKFNDANNEGGKITGSNTTAGAFVGENKGTISDCYNYMDVNAENSAGIAGNIGGKSNITFCDNYGNITGSSTAAGISATATVDEQTVKVTNDDGSETYELKYSDCVNTGNIVTTGNDAKTSGIAGTTNGFGQFSLCRNYGQVAIAQNTSSSASGITCDEGIAPLSISKCLEAGGLDETNGYPIAPNSGTQVRNFYVSGNCTDDITTNPVSVSSLSNNDYKQVVDSYSGYITGDTETAYEANNDGIRKKLIDKMSNDSNASYLISIFNSFCGQEDTGKYHSATQWEKCGFDSFMRKCVAAYITYGSNEIGYNNYAEWYREEWNYSEQSQNEEIDNMIIFIEYIYRNASIPGNMQQARDGHSGLSNSDVSHWPVQLYYKENSINRYDLVYNRAVYYLYAGINDLENNNITAEHSWSATVRDLDTKFIAMANNEAAYPNGDTDNGNSTVSAGFVGNIYQYAPPASGNNTTGNNQTGSNNALTNNTQAVQGNNAITNNTQTQGNDTSANNTQTAPENNNDNNTNNGGSSESGNSNESIQGGSNESGTQNSGEANTGNGESNSQNNESSGGQGQTGSNENESINQGGNNESNQSAGNSEETGTNDSNENGNDNSSNTDNNVNQDPALQPSNDSQNPDSGNNSENNNPDSGNNSGESNSEGNNNSDGGNDSGNSGDEQNG